MNKIIINEHKCNLDDGTSLIYGSPDEKNCNIITIGVRGKIKPIENKKDYKEESKLLKETTIRKANKTLDNTDWIQNHFIFTCDFTEKGILHNKPFRFKYQIYVKPLTAQPLANYENNILDMVKDINTSISNESDSLGFEVMKQ